MQEWNAINYESRKANEHEQCYVTHDLKLVVNMHASKMQMHYLQGRKFVLLIDHSGLGYPFD